MENLDGKVFGDWLALERDFFAEKILKESKGYSKSMWKCKCQNCGIIKTVRSADLKNGKSKNCGCKRRDAAYNKLNLINQKFGKLTVLYEDKIKEENTSYKKSFWVCKCDCRYYCYSSWIGFKKWTHCLLWLYKV